MQTNIVLYLTFSIITVLFFYLIPSTYRRHYLFCVNFIFYFLCDYKFGLLIFLSILWSYCFGEKIGCSIFYRKLTLFLGMSLVLGTLLFFKYYHFFITADNSALGLLMPLGISYYTFKIISYLIDIYLGKRTPEGSFINYAIYVSFFPQIICGPIARSTEITDTLKNDLHFNRQLVQSGTLLILSGLFKKLVIADRLSVYVGSIFSNPTAYPSLALWMAAFFYTIQIYCDFAGYSEIALGIGNLFGFECKINFNLPYFSYNINDFWKRWHISLSSWLRDYIYIPLGGNRKGILRKKINILITFFISGLWHGTGINYICWGMWHGILSLFPFSKAPTKKQQFFHTIATFIFVMFGWIFFRASSIQDAITFIIRMFYGWTITINSIIASVMPFTGDYSCLAHLITVCIFILILLIYEWKEYLHPAKKYPSKYFIYAVAVLFFGAIGQSSFLYANF